VSRLAVCTGGVQPPPKSKGKNVREKTKLISSEIAAATRGGRGGRHHDIPISWKNPYRQRGESRNREGTLSRRFHQNAAGGPKNVY